MIFGEGKFPKILAILLLGFFILHAVAMYFFLYWRVLWLDTPMHFIGGFLAGLIMIWWSFYTKKVSLPKNLPMLYSFVIIVSMAALVGVLWEIYEFTVDNFVTGTGKNYINLTQPSIIDTMKDLFLDITGAALAATIFLYDRRKKERQN